MTFGRTGRGVKAFGAGRMGQEQGRIVDWTRVSPFVFCKLRGCLIAVASIRGVSNCRDRRCGRPTKVTIVT